MYLFHQAQFPQPLSHSPSLTLGSLVLPPCNAYFSMNSLTLPCISCKQLPNLKTSLFLTLQYFFPFAANLVISPPPQMAYVLYTEDGSVSFAVKESKADFNLLTGNHARHLQEFQALVPKLQPATSTASNTDTSGCMIMQKPLIAIQVTIFPKKSELLGDNGILVAAKAIGREVMELEKAPVKGAETLPSKTKEILKSGDPVIRFVASPKLGVYKVDFGWGRPRKTEVASIGSLGSLSVFSIAESRNEEGGVEIRLALAPDDLKSFDSVFNGGLLKQL
ncbi:hypothetical protein REPUB_Repub18cG0067800 [Reevesia pubescens]